MTIDTFTEEILNGKLDFLFSDILCSNLLANWYDKEEYVINITNLKQALNHKLVLKKLHRIIKFNEKARLKPYTEMNTELKKVQKVILKKIFSG